METDAALARRRSCRSYLAQPVDPAVLGAVLSAAGAAPRAGNTFAIDLVVLDTDDTVARYWDVTLPVGPRRDRFRWQGLLRAPCLVLVVVDPESYFRRYSQPDKVSTGLGVAAERWPVPYWWVDAGGAITAILLAATSAGLGSLLFGAFAHEPAVLAAFGVPASRRLVGGFALGHVDPPRDRRDGPGASAPRGRPSVEDHVHRGHWSVPGEVAPG
ncbi:MAG: nitroreductase family protein [Microthrixaceae bacterium]